MSDSDRRLFPACFGAKSSSAMADTAQLDRLPTAVLESVQ